MLPPSAKDFSANLCVYSDGSHSRRVACERFISQNVAFSPFCEIKLSQATRRLCAPSLYAHKFAEKSFADGGNTAKIANVFTDGSCSQVEYASAVESQLELKEEMLVAVQTNLQVQDTHTRTIQCNIIHVQWNPSNMDIKVSFLLRCPQFRG